MSMTIIPRLIVSILLLLSGFLLNTNAQASSHITATHTPSDFVTKWNMAAGDTLTFPGEGLYTINWGDGSSIDNASGVISSNL